MIYCVKTSISTHKRIIEQLARKCLINPHYKIECTEDYCLIPLKNALNGLKHKNIIIIDCSPPLNNFRGKNLRNIVKEYLGEEVASKVPRSYDIIGEAIIIQLPEELKDYYCFISDLLLTLHPNAKSVYRRASETRSEYRIRDLEHIGGMKITETIYREHGLSFYVLLGLVYVNPSFSYEHRLIAEMAENGEKVLDMFAGIGGFTLNIAARKKTRILAVDINPWAVYCGLRSISLNRKSIKSEIIYANSDIRSLSEYIRRDYFDRVIMNLPLYSIDFLPLAIRHVKNGGIIHFYGVEKSLDRLVENVSENIESLLPSVLLEVIDARKVLEYAPYKYIYRIDLVIRKAINTT